MIVLGLSGYAGTGKDTVADYLAANYGFVKFSFSDCLYREVADAFGLPNEDLLRDRATKDTPQEALSLDKCADEDFVEMASAPGYLPRTVEFLSDFNQPLSPRWVLQEWGTAYRRAQDPHYWTARAEEWMLGLRAKYPYAEVRPQLFVNCSVRFANERAFIYDWEPGPGLTGTPRWDGSVWHIHRAGVGPVNGHESETPLEVLSTERELFNDGTVEQLHQAIDLLLRTNARFVRVEPLPPPGVQPDPEITIPGEPVEA